MQVEFFPKNEEDFKYTEGMYLYMACPFLSKNEWHPFTISSASDDDTITVHIRVYPKGWTGRLKDYFELMNPKKRYPFDLTHRDKDGVKPGKCRGIAGEPLIRIDGPHAAPTMHYKEYKTVTLSCVLCMRVP